MAKSNKNYLRRTPSMAGPTLATQQYSANVAAPNQYDAQAQFFGNIKNEFDSDGKAEGGDALISGLAMGAEFGSKLKGIGLKKNELEKYNRVMDYFQNVNEEAEKKNREYEEQEARRLKLFPDAAAAMEMNYSEQPYDIIKTSQKAIFDQAKLSNPDVKGEYIGPVPNSPFINIVDENGQPSMFNLMNITGEEPLERIQSGWRDRQKMALQEKQFNTDTGLRQRSLDIQEGKIKANNTENAGSPTDQIFANQSAKLNAKEAIEYRKNIHNDYQEAQKLETVVNDIAGALEDGAYVNEGALSRVKSYFGLASGGKGATATQILENAVGNLIPKIKEAFGGRVTDADLAFALEYLLPGTKKSKEANLKIINGLRDLIKNKKKQYEDVEGLAERNGGMLPSDYLTQLRKGQNRVEESAAPQIQEMSQQDNSSAISNFVNGPNQDDMVTINTPKGIHRISRERYNALTNK
jgi:hypothetical protein